jgi:succinate dehydrogenase / fumarate reductase cytochrome b subunit
MEMPRMELSDRTYFTLKRLHSLTGVVPVGLFLLEHLYTNAQSLQGAAAFDQAAADLARLPFVVLLEAFGIWLPLLFHMVVGIFISTTAQANVGKHGYARNWHYTLQRGTGILLLFYLLFHTWALRFDPHYLHSASPYQYVNHHLAEPAVLAFYIVGTVAACYHFGNGLFGFAIHWGLVTGRQAQRNMGRVGLAVFVALSLLGVAALLGFRGLRLDFLQKPHGTERSPVVTRTVAR